ncbi:hypothetical protein [Hansschlegelia sp.]|uniref:hypothetical protein n=1 Tax=Hansschlegelia sp. TaxID=2041892 RepID=UPI002BBE9266|nr:hypothetical protein [Hansschlegelia sp.]HVI27484.1 hypothetical protein [Hansschlegelia sp.]
MSRRREFSRKQRAEIILRSTDASGVICCEGCGLRLGRKPYEIDHIVAEALVVDKTKPLTIADGQLLGKECCHRGGKTADDVRRIRKSDRQRDRHTGAMKPASRPILGSKRSGWKQSLSGEWSRR